MEKEKFIGELRKHLSEAGEATKQKHHFRHTRTLGKISPVGIALFIGATVTLAMLSGLLYQQFFVQIQGDIELNGAVVPLFYFDGQPFDNQYFNTTPDITTLSAGETQTFVHHIQNADQYAWNLSFDTSFMDAFDTDPLDPWYGFNFTATPSDWMFIPGETIDVTFVYSLHPEFVGTTLPLDFNITILINRTNAPPVGTDDTVNLNYGQSKIVNITGNDIDFENDHLSIVSWTPAHPSIPIEQVDDHNLRVIDNYGSSGTFTFPSTVTITDGHHQTTETLTITVTL